MSELATAIQNTKSDVSGSNTAVHDALQNRFGFPIKIMQLSYVPSSDSVSVTIRPQYDEEAVGHRLSRGDDDLELTNVQGTMTFEFA